MVASISLIAEDIIVINKKRVRSLAHGTDKIIGKEKGALLPDAVGFVRGSKKWLKNLPGAQFDDKNYGFT